VPPAARSGLYGRTVTVSGLSKAYSITGWRLGWLAAPRALASAIGPVFDVLCVCAPRPLQAAAATALAELPERYYRDARDAYLVRRDRLASALRDAGFAPWVPSGAYYMMADFRERYGAISTRDACFRLLDEIHVATIPGEIFYADEAAPVVRFHFAVEDELLREVARRLRQGRA
jgi:aminotransferase